MNAYANVYLNGLDQFVKHQLKCRHYLRYCDDFVLLAPERETLLDWRERSVGGLDRPHRPLPDRYRRALAGVPV